MAAVSVGELDGLFAEDGKLESVWRAVYGLMLSNSRSLRDDRGIGEQSLRSAGEARS